MQHNTGGYGTTVMHAANEKNEKKTNMKTYETWTGITFVIILILHQDDIGSIEGYPEGWMDWIGESREMLERTSFI